MSSILQILIQLVGIDAIMLMEGRELVFLKLLDAEARVVLNPPRPRNARDALAVAVSLTVGDIGLRDMQVRIPCLGLLKRGSRLSQRWKAPRSVV